MALSVSSSSERTRPLAATQSGKARSMREERTTPQPMVPRCARHLKDQLRRLEGSEMSKGCTDLREEVAARSSASRKRVGKPLDTIRERKRAVILNVYRRKARRADKDSDRNNPERAERKGKGPQVAQVARRPRRSDP